MKTPELVFKRWSSPLTPKTESIYTLLTLQNNRGSASVVSDVSEGWKPFFFWWIWQSEATRQDSSMNPKMFHDQPHLNLRALGFLAVCLSCSSSNMAILCSQSKLIHCSKNQISSIRKLNLAGGGQARENMTKGKKRKVVVMTWDFRLSLVLLHVLFFLSPFTFVSFCLLPIQSYVADLFLMNEEYQINCSHWKQKQVN